MTTLTKEYFNEQLGKAKEEILEEILESARKTAEGFADVTKRLDVRDRVEKLEKQMTKVGSALNVQL